MNIVRAILATFPLIIEGITAQEGKNIVGGVETEKGRYSYAVGLINDNGLLWCGGTLIDPFWVLTAAKCAKQFSKVEIGRHNRFNKTEEYELIDIDFEAPHPNFSPPNDKDIMLVRLKQASNFTPITVVDASIDISTGTDVVALGWGTIAVGSISTNRVLLEAGLEIQDNSDCREVYSGIDTPISENMICASAPGKDTCIADTGGPLIIKGDDSTQDILVGIISFGLGCARDDNYPGVYTNMKTMASFADYYQQCNIDSDFECCSANCLGGKFQCQQATCDFSDDIFCTDSSFPMDTFDYSDCPVEFPCYVGDGYCDDGAYNTPECNYDGGDCCNFTCTDGTYQCSGNAFDTCSEVFRDVPDLVDQLQNTFEVLFGLFQTFFAILGSLIGNE